MIYLFLYSIGPLYCRVLSIFSHKCMCNFAKIFAEKDVNIFILGPITLLMTKQSLFSSTLFCGRISNFLPFFAPCNSASIGID